MEVKTKGYGTTAKIVSKKILALRVKARRKKPQHVLKSKIVNMLFGVHICLFIL